MYATAIPAGTLTIRAARDNNSCELWFNDHFVGSFPSAAAAAQSVSRHNSGCQPIDEGGAHVPESIDAWQWISVSSRSTSQPMFLVRAPAPAASRASTV